MAEDSTTAGSEAVGHGRYVLGRLLGEGGMASVHLARDTVLDRQVAVKTLHTELGREAAFRERFRREAQAVARLAHTNIVQVYDSGEDTAPDGATTPFIVMEYVEGRGLGDLLREAVKRSGGLPVGEALRITADVLAALDASHDQGLVHRDIKPGNVMLTTKGVVKVMDFGIARALQSGVTSMTQTGMVVGTPQYLSPEQALGKPVDARSDLYSVGCMLFELFTGRLPFDGDSPFSIAYKHVQEEPPAPSSLNPAISPGVDALVARALRKDPNLRFPTAAAMADEVERIATAERGGGTSSGAPPLMGEGPRSMRVGPPSTGTSQVPGDPRTPQPQYLGGPVTPQPFAAYQNPVTPQPFPGYPGPAASQPPYQGGYQTPPTPQPQFQAPPPAYRTPQPQFQAPPPAYRTPVPTPQPFPQQQVGPPFPQQQAGPPFGRPGPVPRPGPMPRPPVSRTSGNSGCSTALVVIGVIIGVIVLAVIIVAIVVAGGSNSGNPTDTTTPSYGSQRAVAVSPVIRG